jgi:cold shock CspA family protein
MVNPKGYGFLKVEGRAKDLFFHSTECGSEVFPTLKKGDKVNFESIGSTERGEVALGVSLA